MRAFVVALLAVVVAAWLLPEVAAGEQPVVKMFWTTGGVGDPWGIAVDSAGKIWFAEPGCDFQPTCPADSPPGQIGELDPASGAVDYYTLPDAPGNQPIFVAFDNAGDLWFTTPNNGMIGEFQPSTHTFAGQWAVSAGSGPWDLTFANGQLWYTEHLGSAVGVFDPGSHTHQDFDTPSADSHPYGIAASGGRIWFTENNAGVDRVAVLDSAEAGAISEYPIVQPLSGTPHLIVVAPDGHPWWTEGWADTIATLDPAVATPGNCGPASGTCNGVQRFQLPPSGACAGDPHSSGIAFDAAASRLWLDNSTTAAVGSFTPSTQTFAMTTLGTCSAHPHDGLALDAAGNVWFDEEFANAIGELIPPAASAAPASSSAAPGSNGAVVPPVNTAAPTIGGSAMQGHTLTAHTGSWANAPTHFTYAWQRCARSCAGIASATTASYRLTAHDVDAKVRVVVAAANAAGSARARSLSRGPVAPGSGRVKSALWRLLGASTSRRALTKLLKTGSYRGAFRAPSGGSLRIAWHARRVLVAGAQRRFAKAGAARIAFRLTGRGVRLLERAKKLTLAAGVAFTPTSAAAVRELKRVAIVR